MTFPSIIPTFNDNILAVFGETFTHRATGWGDQTYQGVFDERHETVEIQDGVPVSAIRPMIQTHFSLLSPVPEAGDHLTIRDKTYRISDIQPDGHGWAKLYLIHES